MSNESEDLELGNYRVLHKEDSSLWMLGRGGYGTTYKAEHKHLGRLCALKVINDNLMRNNDAKRRFLQEAQAAALLDHPHIARVYDFGESDGVFYYAMTYCAGGDLEEFSRSRGPQPWSVVKELAQQILPALGMAHTTGLLHRDLKPSNIMLADDDGTVSLRLIDFGLVKVLENHQSASTNMMLTQEGSFMGNPLTASPEQLKEDDLDERSDLFSLGVTLWYLLIGGSPFGGVATAELVHQRLSDESYDSMLPEDLDDEGRLVLSKLLSKDRNDRFRNAEEALAAIEDGQTAKTKKGKKKAAKKKAKAAAGEGRDSEAAVAQVAAPRDWSEIWEIHDQLKKFNYGTYYYCAGLVSGVPGTTLFVPDSQSPYVDSVRTHADKILNADTHLLSGFYQKGNLADEPAYVSPPFPSGDLQCLLHVVGNLSLQDHLPVFQQIATAVDESIARDIPGVELDITDVLLGARENANNAAQTHVEWHEFFQNQKDAGEDYMANLEITLLPKLVDSADIEEAMVTLGSDDLATNPVARFGGLIYRSVSGMSVKQSAYLSPSAHVSTSNISEESNRFLSEVISAREMPESAMKMLRHLCDLEGVDWQTEILDATLSAKDQRRDEVTRTHASMHSLVASLPPPKKKAKKSAPTAGKKAAKKAAKREQLGKAASGGTKKTDPQQLTAAQAASTPIATIPKAAPVATAQPITKEKKQSKHALVVITLSVLACLVMLGGMGWFFFGREDKTKRRSSGGGGEEVIAQVANPVTLQFSDVVAGKATLPSEAAYTITDNAGTLLARFKPTDGTAQVENIAAELFDGAERWPLKLGLSAAGYTMPAIALAKGDFKDSGDDRMSYTKSLKLAAHAFTDVTPEIKFSGKSLPLSVAILSEHLKAEDPSLDWKLSENEGKLRVMLPPEVPFPVKALIMFPGMKESYFKLEQGSQPDLNLELQLRKVTLTGLDQFTGLKFLPDYSKLPDSAVKKALQENPLNYTASSSAFNGGTGSWELPALPGKVDVTAPKGNWSFALSTDAKFRVLTSADRSGNMEMGSGKYLQLIKQAEKGNADAQFKIGLMYYDGEGVAKNEEASTCWFRLGALGNDKVAQFNYALHLELGIGVPKNAREAVEWYVKAAEQGYVKAQLNLGLCYQFGNGVKQSYKEAEKWLTKSASGGSAEGMFNLAVLYGDAAAGMVNHTRAVELYTKSAELGYPAAMFNLGVYYDNGMGGLEPDKAKAMELYRKAAAKNFKQAIDLLKELE